MTATPPEVLEGDTITYIARPQRNSAALWGNGTRRGIRRAGIDTCMWSHLDRAWLIPLGALPAFIRQAEKDRRVVLIEDGTR